MVIEDVVRFKEACKTILVAIDTSEQSVIAETLELWTDEQALHLLVTNREYTVVVNFELTQEANLKATVNALLFLKLIAQLTADSINLEVQGNSLVITVDGSLGSIYKLPLIFNDQGLLELPVIELKNVVSSFEIPASILHSILLYNSKELQSVKSSSSLKPAQRVYYLDEQGAITFTTGACVNNFTLRQPIKVLLGSKVVKLFKLFADRGAVQFAMSQDVDVNSQILTKVRFHTDVIDITALVPSDAQVIRSVPVKAIRDMSNKIYDYSVVLDKNNLQRILSRLLLFKGKDLVVKAELTFNQNGCTISYCNNQEWIGYNDTQLDPFEYKMSLNLETFKNIVDSCIEDYITAHFGDHRAIVLVRQSIKNIIPELVG